MEVSQPATVSGGCGQRDVDRTPPCLWSAEVTDGAGAREERLAGLVQGDRQHPWVVPEDALASVAVAQVDVDVGYSLRAVVQQPLARLRDVVLVTKSPLTPCHLLVQPPPHFQPLQV